MRVFNIYKSIYKQDYVSMQTNDRATSSMYIIEGINNPLNPRDLNYELYVIILILKSTTDIVHQHKKSRLVSHNTGGVQEPR